MVLTRSMAARRTPLALPHDMAVEIAALIAATSPHPMEDICSLRATCQGMHAACKEGAVGSRVALEREESMKWSDNDRYVALVGNLAGAGNPEACFLLGVTLVFTQRCTAATGTQWLKRAAGTGHKAAAYVLGVLHYYGDDKQEAEKYMRQVEGEAPAAAPDGGGVAHGCTGGGRTNRECVRCREQAVDAVREVTTWKMSGMVGPVPVPVLDLPPEESCNGGGCGVPEGWAVGCAIFCSEGCRIRHEYFEFFSRVALPVA